MELKRILLLSNSAQYGRGYLDHAENEICSFLGQSARVAFVPYAMFNWDEYEAKASERFGQMGYVLESVHHYQGKEQELLDKADAVFIGGGNTFRLLRRLYEYDLLSKIRSLVTQGKRYIGSSAGSNVAGPTIKTTKDMPILEPPSFNALALIDFQISPHYLDPDPRSKHMGETQEERILQFLEENDKRVIGLREGSVLLVSAGEVHLKGSLSARLFQRGREPVECTPGPVAW
jgi:dipeptidase E